MTRPDMPTIKQLKATFNPKGGSSAWYYSGIIRPISFFWTWLIIQFGIRSPNTATTIGLIFGILSSVLLATGNNGFLVLAIASICYFFYTLFDVVDGNLARYYDSATYYGKFLDGMVDSFVDAFIIVAAAIGLHNSTGSIFYLYLGFGALWLYGLSVALMNRVSFVSRWMSSEVESTDSGYILKGSKFPLKESLNLLTDIRIFAIILLPLIGLNSFWGILYFASIYIFSGILMVYFLIDAYKKFNVPRISRWDIRNK